MALTFDPTLPEDPEERANEILRLQGSAMGEDRRSPFRRILDFTLGETPSDRLAGFGGLAGFKLVRPVGEAVRAIPREAVGHSVRSMGRDVLEWVRRHSRAGLGDRVELRTVAGTGGPTGETASLTTPLQWLDIWPEGVAKSGESMKDVLAHELRHYTRRAAPEEFFEPVEQTIRAARRGFASLRPVARKLAKDYQGNEIAEELWARAAERDPSLVGGREAQQAINNAGRLMRARLKARLRDPKYQAMLARWRQWKEEAAQAMEDVEP